MIPEFANFAKSFFYPLAALRTALILATRLLATVALMRGKLHAQCLGQRDIREHERRDSSVGTTLDW